MVASLSALLTFTVFAVSLSGLFHAVKPRVLRWAIAVVPAALSAYEAGGAAARAAHTVVALGFLAGTVCSEILGVAGARFDAGMPRVPIAGTACAAVACGLLGGRAASLAPKRAAAISTALIGARGVVACSWLVLDAERTPRLEMLVTVLLATLGFGVQTCVCGEREEGEIPYETI